MAKKGQTIYDELDDLSNSWIEGLLDDTHRARLQEILLTSAEFRNRFVNFVHTDTNLELALQSKAKHAQPLTAADLTIAEAEVAVEQPTLRAPKRRLFIPALLATAAIITIGVLVMHTTHTPEQNAGKLTFQISEGTLFTLTHEIDDGHTPTGKTLSEGSRLQISQGAVELTFSSGVTSVIMAPADLTLTHGNHINLNTGTAWFNVPEKATGFTVLTKKLKVVDLGTKFGIKTDPANLLDEVHVFQGSVLANPKNHPNEEVKLTTHHALQLNPSGHLTTTPYNPTLFLTTLPASLPHLYWSFDNTLAVSGTHPDAQGIHTTAASAKGKSNDKAVFVDGREGQAISFDGHGNHIITNWPGFEHGHPRTVSFWIKLPLGWKSPKSQGLVGWGEHHTDAGKWSIAVRATRKPKNESQAQIIFSLGKTKTVSTTQITLGDWHHIAASYSGIPDSDGQSRSKIYIDGKLTKFTKFSSQVTSQVNTSTQSPNSQPLSLGVTIRPRKSAERRRYFHGMIDELYIIDGYMTKSQIEKLAH